MCGQEEGGSFLLPTSLPAAPKQAPAAPSVCTALPRGGRPPARGWGAAGDAQGQCECRWSQRVMLGSHPGASSAVIYTEVQATPWPPPICPSSKNPLLVRCPWRVLSDPTSEASRLKRKPGVATGAGQPDLPCQSEMARGSRCSSPWEERPEGGGGAAGSGRASGPAGIRDPLGTGQLGAARPGLPERGGFSAGNKGVAAASGPIAEDTIECLGARHCSKRCA